MKKISLLIIVILSLVISPVLAADNCLLHKPVSSTAKYETGFTKQDDKQQSGKMSKAAHCCCEHQAAARTPIGGLAYNTPGKDIQFSFSDDAVSPFGEQPPLEPPQHA